MNKIAIFLTFLLSYSANAQPIECQVLREQILSDVRNSSMQEQRNLYFANQVSSAEASRPGLGSVYSANVMGANGVQQLASIFGGSNQQNSMSFEQKVATYKAACEK